MSLYKKIIACVLLCSGTQCEPTPLDVLLNPVRAISSNICKNITHIKEYFKKDEQILREAEALLKRAHTFYDTAVNTVSEELRIALKKTDPIQEDLLVLCIHMNAWELLPKKIDTTALTIVEQLLNAYDTVSRRLESHPETEFRSSFETVLYDTTDLLLCIKKLVEISCDHAGYEILYKAHQDITQKYTAEIALLSETIDNEVRIKTLKEIVNNCPDYIQTFEAQTSILARALIPLLTFNNTNEPHNAAEAFQCRVEHVHLASQAFKLFEDMCITRELIRTYIEQQ